MDNRLIFVLCAPDDYEWTEGLVERLRQDRYIVYLEPFSVNADDVQARRRTSDALYSAQIMLAIISEASAISAAAPTFDAWWRPFLQSHRPLIPCLMPSAPAAEKNWMPFDLTRLPRVDFRQPEAYSILREMLRHHHVFPESSNSLQVVDLPATSMPSPVFSAPQLPQQPPPVVKTPQRDKTRQNETRQLRQTNFLSLILGLLGVVLAWMGVWQSTAGNTATALLWLAGVVAIFSLLFLTRLTARAQKRHQEDIRRRKSIAAIKQKKATSPEVKRVARPRIYLEVLESDAVEDIGMILPIYNEISTIGRGAQNTLVLGDKGVDKTHCQVIYDAAAEKYYLESTSRKSTVLLDSPLRTGERRSLQNGDLILLGAAVILQFRAHHH